MKTALIALAAVTCLGLSAQAFAQTCASPLPITSGGTPNGTRSGNLCTATNTLPGYGGVPSPQAEVVYSFVAQSANATITVAMNSFGGTVVLMPSPCSSSTDITAAGNAGNPMVVSGLTNGATYYVIMTADPGGPPAACGPYTLTVAGTLPVSLQGFSVE